MVADGFEAGTIFLVGELDYELEREYVLQVCASNEGEPTSAHPTATQTVTVSVTDENDNSPSCTICPFHMSVDENSGTGMAAYMHSAYSVN